MSTDRKYEAPHPKHRPAGTPARPQRLPDSVEVDAPIPVEHVPFVEEKFVDDSGLPSASEENAIDEQLEEEADESIEELAAEIEEHAVEDVDDAPPAPEE